MTYDEHARVDEARALGQRVFAATICPVCEYAAYIRIGVGLCKAAQDVKHCVCMPPLVVLAESIVEAHGWAAGGMGDGRGERMD